MRESMRQAGSSALRAGQGDGRRAAARGVPAQDAARPGRGYVVGAAGEGLQQGVGGVSVPVLSLRLRAVTTVRTDEKGFSNLGRLVTLVRASAASSAPMRAGARKVVDGDVDVPGDAPASTSVSCAAGRNPALALTARPPSNPSARLPQACKFTQQELPAWRPSRPPAWVRGAARSPRPPRVRRSSRAARRALPERARRRRGRRCFVLSPKQRLPLPPPRPDPARPVAVSAR